MNDQGHDYLMATAPTQRAPQRGPNAFEERGTEEQLALLYAALAEASGAFEEPKRTKHVKVPLKSGGFYEYDYAPLNELIAATRPALAAAGIFISQPPVRVYADRVTEKYIDDKGQPAEEQLWVARVLTVVSHKGGARLVYSMEFFALNEIKDFGGQITYGRRYQYQAVVGVDAGELDADDMPRANGKEEQPQVTRRERQAPTPARQEAKAPTPPKPAPQATRPQEAMRPEPTPAPRPASVPPPAPVPAPAPAKSDGPSNAEIQQGLVGSVEIIPSKPAPAPEPTVEREEMPRVDYSKPETEGGVSPGVLALDERGSAEAVSFLFGKALAVEEVGYAIRVAGRAIGITKGQVGVMCDALCGNPVLAEVSPHTKRQLLLELIRRRQEQGV